MTARDPFAARPVPPIEKVTRERLVYEPVGIGGRPVARAISISLPRVKFLERPVPAGVEIAR